MDEQKDLLQRRCPRLGGPVNFRYCRIGGDEEMPCLKVIDCWWEYFDVLAFFQQALPADRFRRLLRARPAPRVSSLIELIEQAKARCRR